MTTSYHVKVRLAKLACSLSSTIKDIANDTRINSCTHDQGPLKIVQTTTVNRSYYGFKVNKTVNVKTTKYLIDYDWNYELRLRLMIIH